MRERNILLYLQDIDDALNKIFVYTEQLSFSDFIEDEKTIDAVIRNLEIIGEAANNIPAEIQKKYTDIPWRSMIGMRHKIIHEYFGVDWDILWKTIQDDLPYLKNVLKQCIKDFS